MAARATAPIRTDIPEYRFEAVDSRTVLVCKRDDSHYRVTLSDGRPVACTCPGHHFRGYCKHQEMVAGRVEGGWLTLPVPDVRDPFARIEASFRASDQGAAIVRCETATEALQRELRQAEARERIWRRRARWCYERQYTASGTIGIPAWDELTEPQIEAELAGVA